MIRIALFIAAAASACGSKPPADKPVGSTPLADKPVVSNPASTPTPAADATPTATPWIDNVKTGTTVFGIGGVAYRINFVASELRLDDNEVHLTGSFKLELMTWPDSDDYVQTLAEQKDAPGATGATILHEKDNGRGNFELVSQKDNVDDGTFLKPGEYDGVMCKFKVDSGTDDWALALAACRSVRPDDQ